MKNYLEMRRRFRRRLLIACTIVGMAGCNRQGTFDHVDSGVTFDGGGAEWDLPRALPGNALPLPEPAQLATIFFTIRDGDSQAPLPCRVIFRKPPGGGFAEALTGPPTKPTDPGGAVGAVIGPGVLGSPEGVLLQMGVGSVPVPPGGYDLFITAGPEWEAVETHVNVVAGQTQPVNAWLDHTVDTGGWLSADLHVHTKTSFDSKIPADRRMMSMVTNGVELIVTTDHNAAFDGLPVLRELGYGPERASVLTGSEQNFKEGHAGVYPVKFDASSPNGGVPPWQAKCDQPPVIGTNCMADVEAFRVMHSLVPNQTVVTLNHPWWPNGDLGYFTNINWGAGTKSPLPAPLRSAGLFDALEITNGYWVRQDAYTALLADWFFILSQGHRVTALGSSDTHRINWVRAGWPRSWLRLPTDTPGDVTGADLAEAIRKGRAIASTGPFARLGVDDGDIGDLVRPQRAGLVAVNVTVDAPAWMALDDVWLYVDGREREHWKVGELTRPRFTVSKDEAIVGDSWIVLLASGNRAMPADVVGEHASVEHRDGMVPWVVTNPVFVDGDGDGMWHPTAGWSGPPVPLDTLTQHVPNAAKTKVPADCEGGPDTVDGEPPLNAMQAVMPLLFP